MAHCLEHELSNPGALDHYISTGAGISHSAGVIGSTYVTN
jgi:hypothetical protein